jgi:alpha-mannosidase
MWTATDGSAVQAHWLYQSYCQGNGVLCPPDESGCAPNPVGTGLSTLVSALPTAPTPFFFVPIDCDFTPPFNGTLLTIVSNWNQTQAEATGVYIVLDSFNTFMDLVSWSSGDGSQLPSSALTLNPYYSGSYASRMDLKITHYQATRLLLQAETLAVLLDALAAQGGDFTTASQRVNGEIATAWNTLIPSTHHDYITATAIDPVYTGEQQPLLATALAQAGQALADVQTTIANAVAPSVPWTQGLAVVFNGSPTVVNGLAELTTAPSPFPQASAVTANGPWCPTQRSYEGSLLFLTSAPALGYGLTYFSETESGAKPLLSYSVQDGSITLTNDMLSATIDVNGGLTSVKDFAGTELLSGTANTVLFYGDEGNIYRFGYEINQYSTQKGAWQLDTTATIAWQPPQLVETGPLRLRVIVQGAITISGSTLTFTQEYRLVANAASLWMSTSGTAPSPYSVMLSFPLARPIASLQHGTTYHWNEGVPRNFFASNPASGGCDVPADPLTFEATHEYVLPTDASGVLLAGLYHAATPAWAIDTANRQNLLACILRNTPGSTLCNAAVGTDSGEHVAVYALRVPSSLGPPTALEPLREALALNFPLMAVQPGATPTANPPLDESLTIAGTDQYASSIVSAIKASDTTPGELIVRVYQPTNTTQEVIVTVNTLIAQGFTSHGLLNVAARTALEGSTTVDLNLSSTATTFSLTTARAIATVALIPG